MPGMDEASQVGKRQEISNMLFNVEAADTPVATMLRKDPKPAQKLMEWQVEAYAAPAYPGVMDGADVTAFSSTGRTLLYGRTQQIRKPWKVSQFADVTDIAAIQGERAHQKALALIDLKLALEALVMSMQDSAVDDAGAQPNQTRGAFKWLTEGAQGDLPVDAAFRPAAGTNITGALSGVTEDVIQAAVAMSYKVRRTSVSLDGFVGIDLKHLMDDWMVVLETGSATAMPVRTFDQGASETLTRMVSVLKFSAGTVRLHAHPRLLLDSAGAETAYTHKSGIFLDMRMWSLAFQKRPGSADLQDEGGGPRGYHDLIAGLKCGNPLGQFYVYCNS